VDQLAALANPKPKRNVRRIQCGQRDDGWPIYDTAWFFWAVTYPSHNWKATCPPGTFVTGIYGRAGACVDQIGITCCDGSTHSSRDTSYGRILGGGGIRTYVMPLWNEWNDPTKDRELLL
jgi:hypothetical protein